MRLSDGRVYSKTGKLDFVNNTIAIDLGVVLPPWPQDVLDAISGVKGMFVRIFRMDQWDWFTVYTQLGHCVCRHDD
jgi:hypothetical protein